MAVSDVLKNYRSSGYSSGKANSGEKQESPGPRVIKLSEEEVKGLEPYQVKPGEEIILEVTGRLQGNDFTVLSAKYATGGQEPSEDEDSKAVAEGLVGPMSGMPTKTIPSPS